MPSRVPKRRNIGELPPPWRSRAAAGRRVTSGRRCRDTAWRSRSGPHRASPADFRFAANAPSPAAAGAAPRGRYMNDDVSYSQEGGRAPDGLPGGRHEVSLPSMRGRRQAQLHESEKAPLAQASPARPGDRYDLAPARSLPRPLRVPPPRPSRTLLDVARESRRIPDEHEAERQPGGAPPQPESGYIADESRSVERGDSGRPATQAAQSRDASQQGGPVPRTGSRVQRQCRAGRPAARSGRRERPARRSRGSPTSRTEGASAGPASSAGGSARLERAASRSSGREER